MKKIIIAGIGFAVLGFSSFVLAGDVTVAWDANTEENLAGYKLYYGTSSRDYPQNVDVGNNTQHTLTDITNGVLYYYAATAYDADANESELSEEISYILPLADTSMGDIQKMRKKVP